MVDPYELLFGGMEKLGPGSDADTLQVLRSLPPRSLQTIVDAGCGTGRQTLVLAGELRQVVHAVDTHVAFLRQLTERAEQAGLAALVQTHALDMAELGNHFKAIDLLWAEGSAYSIGFERALHAWRPTLADAGLLVVSELCWLNAAPPAAARDFFAAEYPEMKSTDQVGAICERVGLTQLGTHSLPTQAWREGFYDELQPRAEALVNHADAATRELAQDMLKEIEIFSQHNNSYGYVFFVLERR
ncbi:MAG: class I SAM-dependent methyltransferase [Planctomycetota bacterium]